MYKRSTLSVHMTWALEHMALPAIVDLSNVRQALSFIKR